MLTTLDRQVAQLLERVDTHTRRAIKQFVERYEVHDPARLRSLPAILDSVDDLVMAVWLLPRVGGGRDSASTFALMMCLRHGESRVRAEAARSFAVRRTPRVVPALELLIRTDPAEDVRAASAYTLGQVGYVEGIPILERALRDAQQPAHVRGMAAEALGVAHAYQDTAIDALIAGLDDASPDVRFWCASALGSLGVPRALSALRKLHNDETRVAGIGTVASEAQEAIQRIEHRDRSRVEERIAALTPVDIVAGTVRIGTETSQTFLLVWQPSQRPDDSILNAVHQTLADHSRSIQLGDALIWFVHTDDISALWRSIARVVHATESLFVVELKGWEGVGRARADIIAFLTEPRPKHPRPPSKR